MGLSESFWRWVYRLAKLKFREAHLSRIHNDIKCPGCKEWFSITGMDNKHTHEREPNSGLSICTCGQCGTKSYWSAHIAPFPVRVDESGMPIDP